MSDISLEELLKTLEEAESKEVEEKKPVHRALAHMDRFLSELDIKIGPDRVPSYVIFYHYKMIWEGIQSGKKANKIKFFRDFNRRDFVQARVGKERRYLLDGSSFDLSREGKLKAKHYDERYNKNIKKKANEKKQREISKSKKRQESKE